MHFKKLLLSGCVLAAMAAMLLANAGGEPGSGAAMTRAARALLETLTDEQRQQVHFEYDDPERLNWHYIPRPRKGVPLKGLNGRALQSAHRLVAEGLSASGYDQAIRVMSLEEVLFLLEGGERIERRARRDPQKYFLSIFGRPAAEGTWGWRLEGHHLSLNYSVKDGETVATTPEFFGANPALVDAGPERSIRVLGPEEDLAREILNLCTEEQQQRAWIDKQAPRDVRGGGEPQPETTAAVGLAVSQMRADQKQLTAQLLAEYLKNMPPDIEHERRARIESAGMDEIRFAWWGSAEPNEPHYYRLQGPTFLVEFNNVQNNANHVHSMWRNLAGDFNLPLEKGEE